MKKTAFYRPHAWSGYSKKLSKRIESPQFVGFFLPQEVEGRSLRLVTHKKGSVDEEYELKIYLLVDELDGVIVDVRYQVMGPSALIGALEAACQLVMRKTYLQAKRMSADLIDRELRDKPDVEAFPVECYGYLNVVLEVIEMAADECMDIPLNEADMVSPLTSEMLQGSGVEDWEALSLSQRKALIEEVIQTDIRPYIELDAGGIQIVDLSETHQLTIAYQGSCTSCHSATGSTLQAIEQILRAKLFAALEVVPDLSFLKIDPL